MPQLSRSKLKLPLILWRFKSWQAVGKEYAAKLSGELLLEQSGLDTPVSADLLLTANESKAVVRHYQPLPVVGQYLTGDIKDGGVINFLSITSQLKRQ